MKKQSWTNRKIKFDNYFSISKVFQDYWKIWSNLNVFLSRNSKTVCNIDDTAQKMKFSIKDFFSKCDSKLAVSCGFGHIYWRNPQWKTSFFVKCDMQSIMLIAEKYFIKETTLRQKPRFICQGMIKDAIVPLKLDNICSNFELRIDNHVKKDILAIL